MRLLCNAISAHSQLVVFAVKQGLAQAGTYLAARVIGKCTGSSTELVIINTISRVWRDKRKPPLALMREERSDGEQYVSNEQ